MSDTTKVWIGFSTTNKLLSRIIRWCTRGKSSHAWMRYWDATLEQHMVIQAEIEGYETIPWKRWKKQNILIAVYESKELDLMPGVRHMASFLGVAYDFKSALWTGLKRWLGKKFKRPFHSPKKLMCSEAVCLALQYDKVPCVEKFNPELVSPQELENAVSSSADFTKVSFQG